MRIEYDFTENDALSGFANFEPSPREIRLHSLEEGYELENLAIWKDGEVWRFAARATEVTP